MFGEGVNECPKEKPVSILSFPKMFVARPSAHMMCTHDVQLSLSSLTGRRGHAASVMLTFWSRSSYTMG
jgi:hypothetical protein